ncbi:MAG: family 2A encapsulin nanocompartment cargo protein cysteine desulfurase [Terracidiphilus sp.]|jgi:cysteine desulfurase/selenocysteine lyase
MSTTDARILTLDKTQPGEAEANPGLVGVVPAGLPDASVIARLANELFTALPGASQPAFAGAQGVDLSAINLLSQIPATSPSGPSELSLPSDAHLPSAPSSAGPAVIAPVSTNIQAAPPVVPGTMAGSVPDTGAHVPGFGFLAENRPIFSDGVSASASPEAAPITDFVKPVAPVEVALPDFGNDSAPAQVELFSPPSPTSPGAFGFADSSAIPAFSFLEEARPIFSGQIPGPVPAAALESPSSSSEKPVFGPGSTYNSVLPSAAPSFGFLSDARGIESTSSAETPDQARLEPDIPADLKLSSYPFDAQALRQDFPILRERVNGRPLIWLDNGATTQKPLSVIERVDYYYKHENSNVHRAAHELAARSTDAYESAREKTRRFLNASSAREIIFVRGATEGINLIAQSWGRQNIQKDDEIVITWLEHHANIVPWQMLCAETGARLRVAPVDDSGQILLDEYEKLLGPKTRLVSITQVSNALGTITPAAAMIEAAHRRGAKVLLDGAQAVSHMRVDVQALSCDFFVFSGHKVFAPTGIGVVYGKSEILEHTLPWQGGGNMIQDVTFEKTIYQPAPQRFEAGTGNIADAVGLGAAIDYVERVGMENIARHEHELLTYATSELLAIPGLCIIGKAKEKAAVISFVLDGFRNEEIGDYLNRNGIAVRAGHHCAQPILRRFGLESTVRATLALYNTRDDIDALVLALRNLRFGHTSIA